MPLHNWMITRRARDYYRELKRSQWLPPAEMRELQEQKLRRLVQHAYATSPTTASAFDELGHHAGRHPRRSTTCSKLPLLTKDDVREHLYFDLMSDNHDKRRMLQDHHQRLDRRAVRLLRRPHQLEFRWAATLRSQEWTGYRFGDRRCASGTRRSA